MTAWTPAFLNRFADNNPAALLFDLDGTLVDSVPDLSEATDAMLKDLDFSLAGEHLVRQWVGNGARRLVQRALAHALKTEEQKITSDFIDQAQQLFLNHYHQSSGRHSRLYDGVFESLSQWQKQQRAMAVVTNKPIEFVPQLLADLSLNSFFKVLVGGDSTAKKKPNPQPLLFACEQLHVDPQQCLMVGDSRNDVLAAKAAHMPVIAVDYGYNHGEPITDCNPDCVVSCFSEIQLNGN